MKGFSTFFTPKGFFSSVGHMMQDKNRVVVKALSTFMALIGLLTSVNPLVAREV